MILVMKFKGEKKQPLDDMYLKHRIKLLRVKSNERQYNVFFLFTRRIKRKNWSNFSRLISFEFIVYTHIWMKETVKHAQNTSENLNFLFLRLNVSDLLSWTGNAFSKSEN